MDLASPLRSLVPSLDSAVLEVLSGTESGLSSVQIARLARRGTRTGQRPVLDRLVAHGLVIADRSNTGWLYRLNRDHLLAPAVLLAVGARHELLARLRPLVHDLGSGVVHASVFGSSARGEAGPDSDVDLLLVVEGLDPHDEVWADGLLALQDRVLGWSGNRLEPLVLTTKGFASAVARDEPIIAAWSRDAITLVGPQPDALVRQLGDPRAEGVRA